MQIINAGSDPVIPMFPISRNKWYAFDVVGAPVATINVIADSPDDVFYIYTYATMLNITLVTFNLVGASPDNIYFITAPNMTVFLSQSPMYGNFIGTTFFVEPFPVTLNGTMTVTDSAGGTCLVNNDEDPITTNRYLTINFDTVCFMKGTKVLTDHWYVPIEHLKVGDRVVTQGVIHENSKHVVDDIVSMPIVDIRKHVRKPSKSASPIVFTKNAFSINKPFENLYVSPNHGMIDRKGRLCPASKLINNTTIYQDPTVETIEYYHIELASHCAINANGLLTESFLKPSIALKARPR
jgi:hypothetical protein